MMKTILVTGATNGIGKQTALDLAKQGHKILIHGRDENRLEKTINDIFAQVKGALLFPLLADLSSLKQVQLLSETIHAKHPDLNVVIHNAGVYMHELILSIDGFEITFAVNHLAPFLLTNLVLDILEKNAPSRIVTVTSVAHQRGSIHFDDLNLEHNFNGYKAYAQSKLANILFSNCLAEKVKDRGITSNCLHPGVISTKLLRNGFGMEGASVEEGAATSVYLAADPAVEAITGKYFIKKLEAQCSATANDKTLQEQLWQVSEEMTIV